MGKTHVQLAYCMMQLSATLLLFLLMFETVLSGGRLRSSLCQMDCFLFISSLVLELPDCVFLITQHAIKPSPSFSMHFPFLPTNNTCTCPRLYQLTKATATIQHIYRVLLYRTHVNHNMTNKSPNITMSRRTPRQLPEGVLFRNPEKK